MSWKVRALLLSGLLMAITFWMSRNWLIEQVTGEPRTVEGLQKAGIKALGRNEPGEAVAALQRAAALNDKRSDTRYLLAQALESAGRTEEAIREYRAAIVRDPSLAAPHYNQAVIYRLQGNYAGTEAELKEALHLFPQFNPARLMLGTLYYNRGDWTGAHTELTQVAAQTSFVQTDRVALHLMLGHILEQLGENKEAAEHWRQVLALEPENQEARKRLNALPMR